MIGFYAQHSRLIDQIGINALLALSLSVSLQAGQLALAQAGLAGIAAYVSAIAALQYHWPLAASILLAVACSTLVAALLAYPVRKIRGIFLAIATIGFGEIVRVIVNNLSVTGGAEGLSGIPNDVNTPIIYGGLALVAGALFLLSRTKFALAGAAFLSILPEVIRALADFREITNGLILLVVILFAPNGLSALWRTRRAPVARDA
jgi:branched-chain amino acid transport system permease protein